MGKKGGTIALVQKQKEMISVFLLPEQASRSCLVALEVWECAQPSLIRLLWVDSQNFP